MSDKRNRDGVERVVDAYERMLERVHELVESTEKKTMPRLREAVIEARERAVELGELTREEADKVARYLERDVHEAGEFMNRTGQEFREWFRFDWQLASNRLLDMFASVADQTSLALREVADRAHEASLYHAEEVTGPGSLVCERCGEVVHFRHVSRIPPCPNCHHTVFHRAVGMEEARDGVDQGDVDGD